MAADCPLQSPGGSHVTLRSTDSAFQSSINPQFLSGPHLRTAGVDRFADLQPVNITVFLLHTIYERRSLRQCNLLLSRPYTSLVMADKAFFVSAPKICNDLSFNCRAATCVNSFKRNLKRELFYTAYGTLITPSNSRLSRLRIRFFGLGLIGPLQIGFVFV